MNSQSTSTEDQKKFISTREAARETGYTATHISLLARGGEISAIKDGRRWLVEMDSLQSYVKSAELEKEVLRQKMSEEARSIHRSDSSSAALQSSEEVGPLPKENISDQEQYGSRQKSIETEASQNEDLDSDKTRKIEDAIRSKTHDGNTYLVDDRPMFPELSIPVLSYIDATEGDQSDDSELLGQRVIQDEEGELYDRESRGALDDEEGDDVALHDTNFGSRSLSERVISPYSGGKKSKKQLFQKTVFTLVLFFVLASSFALSAPHIPGLPSDVREYADSALYSTKTSSLELLNSISHFPKEIQIGHMFSSLVDTVSFASAPRVNLAAINFGSAPQILQSIAVDVYRSISSLFKTPQTPNLALEEPTQPPIETPTPDPTPQIIERTIVIESPPQVQERIIERTSPYAITESELNLRLASVASDIRTREERLEALISQVDQGVTTINYITDRQDENAREDIHEQIASGVSTQELSVSGDSMFDTDTLYIDSKNNRVGIGTLLPTALLDVGGVFSVDPSGNLSTTGTITSTSFDTTNLTTENLTVTGSLISEVPPSFPSFNATSSSATSTIEGSLVIDTDLLHIDSQTNRIGIGTTTPTARLTLTQSENGTAIIAAQRITDTAPSGDFISYTQADGTSLYRVDNSGNVTAGGNISSGSISITSISTPQLRIQYDASNEWTASTDANGNTTFALNGTTPTLSFTPESDATNTFNFTDSALNSILSIDTENGRVGVGTSTPGAKLEVYGGGGIRAANASGNHFEIIPGGFSYSNPPVIINQHGEATFRETAFISQNSVNEIVTIQGAPGQSADLLQWKSNSTILGVIDSSGNVGIGTTSPSAKLHAYTSAAGGLIGRFESARDSATDSDGVYLDLVRLNSGPDAMIRFKNTAGGETTNFQFGLDGDGTNNLYIQNGSGTNFVTVAASTGNVGVGTTAPAFSLEVAGAGGSSHRIALTDSGDSFNRRAQLGFSAGNGGLISAWDVSNNQNILLRSYGDSYFTGGNVGIGTTNPGVRLDILGAEGEGVAKFRALTSSLTTAYPLRLHTARNAAAGGTGMGTGIDFYIEDTGSNDTSAGRLTVSYSDGTSGSVSSDLKFSLANSGSLADIMTLRGSGNVGIGTTSPAQKLHVEGDVQIGRGGVDYSYLLFRTPAGRSQIDSFDENGSPHILTLNTSGGNVGIGTTGPSSLLHLSSADTQLRIEDTDTGNPNIRFDEDGAARAHIGYFNSDNTFRIAGNSGLTDNPTVFELSTGNVGIGTTGPGNLLTVSAADGGPGDNLYAASIINLESTAGRNFGLNVQGGSNSSDAAFRIRNIGNTDLVYVRGDGNVGIGTTTPGALLNVFTDATGEGILVNSITATVPVIDIGSARGANADAFLGELRGFWDGGEVAGIVFETGDDTVNKDDGRISFLTAAAGNSPAERMRIEPNGNVGIGTTAPGTRFEVVDNGASGLVVANIRQDDNSPYGLMVSNNAYSTTVGHGIGLYLANSISRPLSQIYAADNGVLASDLELLTDGTVRLTVDNTGNVGIGTTAPVGRLHVANATNGQDAFIKVQAGGTTGDLAGVIFKTSQDTSDTFFSTGILVEDTGSGVGKLHLANSNSSSNIDVSHAKLTVDEDGNVGIGTTAPTYRLQVIGSSASADTYSQTSLFEGRGGQESQADLELSSYRAAGVGLGHFLIQSWRGDAVGSTVEDLILQGYGGNVGIGTTDPDYKLEVAGNVHIDSSASDGGLMLDSRASSYITSFNGVGVYSAGDIFDGTSGHFGSLVLQSRSSAGRPILFVTGSTPSEKVRIQSNGSVGIGTTDPGAKLHVAGESGTQPVAGILTSSASNGLLVSGVDGVLTLASRDDNTAVSHAIDFPTYKNSDGTLTDKFSILGWRDTGAQNSNLLDRLTVHYGTSAIASANSSLFTIKRSGNVGIGTTDPTRKLSVYNATVDRLFRLESGDEVASFELIDTNGTSVIEQNSLGLSLSSDAGVSDHLVIDTTGKVGIGTTTPGATLTVDGSATFGDGANYGMFDADGDLTINGTADYLVEGNSYAFRFKLNENFGMFFNADDTRFEFHNGFATRMFSVGATTGDGYFAGNVGVGTTDPDQTLDVEGSFGGNLVTSTRSTTGTNTVSTEGFAYDLQANTGASSATVTFNITGLPAEDGTFAAIRSSITNTSNADVTVIVQIAGTQISTFSVDFGQDPGTREESYVVVRMNGSWRIIGHYYSEDDSADLAEWTEYTGEKPLAGELVSFDPDGEESVIKTTTAKDQRVAGVVSTFPHTVMGKETPTSVQLTLAGRVPVKVSLENGPIYAGDKLTSSSVPGVAMKATEAGMVVGTAMTNVTEVGSNEYGIAVVLVGTSYWAPGSEDIDTIDVGRSEADTTDQMGTVRLTTASSTVQKEVPGFFSKILLALGAWIEDGVTKFERLYAYEFDADVVRAREIKASERLCIGETCVTEDELKALLGGGTGTSGGNVQMNDADNTEDTSESSENDTSTTTDTQTGEDTTASSTPTGGDDIDEDTATTTDDGGESQDQTGSDPNDGDIEQPQTEDEQESVDEPVGDEVEDDLENDTETGTSTESGN